MNFVNWTLTCKGGRLVALIVWFHLNQAGILDSTDDVCFFLSLTSPILKALRQ